jgi:SAM-dependent methyltransferase
MLESTRRYVQKVNQEGGDLKATLARLRVLHLDEFGELLLTLPDPALPHLSQLLPRATDDAVQVNWTGASGITLLRQSTTFVRSLASDYMILTGRNIGAATVLDFGCGWARLLRLMPYYTAPENLYGCDSWDVSLDHARAANALAHLAKSDVTPNDLPFPGVTFDLTYSFSVFTHLPAPVAKAVMGALRRRIKPEGLLAITVRPSEYWAFIGQHNKRDLSRLIEAHNATGYAYLGHSDREHEYGDTSMSLEFIAANFPDWQVVRAGAALQDPLQVVVYLKPRT